MAKRKTKTRVGTRKTSLNKRRKGIGAVLLPWFKRFGMIVTSIIFIVWLGAWFFLSDANENLGRYINEKIIQKTADLGFRVENILVEGRKHTDSDIIMALVNMEQGDPLFAFDPASAKAQIEKITWVNHAQISRRWPDTIHIRLTERTPVALWQHKGRLRLLDQYGEIIAANAIDNFKNLIIVSGEEANKQTPALLALLLAEPELLKRIDRADFIAKRRWDLRLKNDLALTLPEDDIGLALSRVMKAQNENQILDKGLKSIDLRKSDRMIVRTKPGKAQDYQEFKANFSARGDNI